MGLLIAVWETYLEMAPYLVLGLIFAGVLHIFVKKSFVEDHLGKPGIMSVIKASVLGVPLPLCSCGVVPTALSLKSHNASNGAVVSFLVSTPQTGVDSIVATYGLMGPFFALFRPIAAFIMGIFGGFLTMLFGEVRPSDKMIHPSEVSGVDNSVCTPGESCSSSAAVAVELKSFREKVVSLFKYGFGDFLHGISTYILLGIVISGVITYFLPDDFFTQYVGNQWVEMLLMVLGGVPLYICSTGSIPIALSLMMKGLSPGAAFVFLAVGPATNAATITVVKSKLGTKVTLIYLASMIISSMFAGWLLNSMKLGDLISHSLMSAHVHHESTSLMDYFLFTVSILFLYPLSYSLFKNHLATPLMRLRKGKSNSGACCTYTLTVEGMTCQNCAKHVVQAALSVEGITNAEVDLGAKSVTITGEKLVQALKESIEKEGYVVILNEE